MSSGTGSASVPGSQSSTNPAEKVRIKYTNHAAHVTTMPGGVTHIHEVIGQAGTAATFDFSATPIKAFKLIVTNDTAGTAQLPGSIVYCIDPPNDTIRDAWLADASSLAADTNRIPLVTGETDEVSLTDPIDYIGLNRCDGTETFRVVCIGVVA